MQNKEIEPVRNLLRQVDSNARVRQAIAQALGQMAPQPTPSAQPAEKMPTG